jgi:DNA-binding transcriptional LysR family regulator
MAVANIWRKRGTLVKSKLQSVKCIVFMSAFKKFISAAIRTVDGPLMNKHRYLNLLHAFKLLMEERSVSRAAEKMFISQSAMSHILQRLRNQLDDPVLVKTAAGMKPTLRAQALLEPIKTVLKDVEQIIRDPEKFSPTTSQKRFVIATSDYVEFTLLPKLTESINKHAPNIEIHVQQPINKLLETAIEEEEIDFVIGFDAIFNLPLYIRHEILFNDKVVCIAKQEHQSLTGTEISFEQFIASRHMLISPKGAGTGLMDDYSGSARVEQKNISRHSELSARAMDRCEHGPAAFAPIEDRRTICPSRPA